MENSPLKSSLISLRNENKRLEAKERDLKVAHEARLSAISEDFKAQKEAIKTQNEKEILDLHETNDAKLLEKINEREERLAEQQKMIEKTNALLDRTKSEISTQKLAEIEEMKALQSDRYQKEFQSAQETMDLLNEKSQHSIASMNFETENTLQKLTQGNKQRVDALTKQGEMRSQNKSQEFRRLGAYQDMEFSKIMRQKEFEHQKDIGELERQFLIEKEGRTQSFAQQKQVKTSEHEEALKQLDKSFHEKYQAMVTNHDAVMNHLRSRFEIDLKEAAQSLSQSKENIENRAQDSFYGVEKLSPNVSEDEKSYTISISIPEHERDGVNLSADGRNIRLSISRRFEERLEDMSGEVNKTSRTEHHTKSFRVAQIVDQGKITQSYQDGILSYKIMKA